MKTTTKLLAVRRTAGIIALAAVIGFSMAGCDGIDAHTHDFSGEWKSDATHHWHECPNDGEKDGYAEHAVTTWTQTKAASILEDGEESGTCTVCGAAATRPIAKGLVEMVSIPAGTFLMGSPTDEPGRDSDETQHSVTLTQGFYMGKYQVTQEQYQAVMGTNPSRFTTDNIAEGEVQEKRPVEVVRWYDALVFCNKLSVMEGLTPAYSISGSTDPDDWGTVPTSSNATWNAVTIVADSTGYRLPTEAQWEYACRAGTTTAYNTGDTSDDTGWNDGNFVTTHEVGLKPPNAWGLYDMHGNVGEWCQDWYGSYSNSDETDPTGASSGSVRVRRGGWFDYDYMRLHSARSAYRGGNNPSSGFTYVGFRLVRP